MHEILVLQVTDLIDALQEGLVRRNDGTEGEGMDSRSTRLFLLQGGAARDGGVDGHVVVSVHFLEISAKPHQKQADKGHVVFLTEVHQPLCRFGLQVENVQRGIHRIGNVDGRPEIRPVHPRPLRFQRSRSVDAVIDGLGGLDDLLEVCRIPFLRRRVRLIGQIPLHLLQIGGHVLRIGHTFIFRVTVQLDDILQKADQGLGVHGHVIHQKIQTVEAVRHPDHDDPVHGRILPFEWYTGPAAHQAFRLLHGLPGKVHELDVPLLLLHHILIPVSFLIRREAQTHGIASLISLIDGPLQFLPVKLRLYGQAGADVQHFLFRAEILVKKVKLLSSRQRIYGISLSFSHHTMRPPKNSFIAFS